MTIKERNPALSYLRATVCTSVFLCHLGQRIQLRNVGGVIPKIIDFGQYGVIVFFAISGYLSFMSLDSNREQRTLNWYKRKAKRILPLYYLVIIYFFITEDLILHNMPVDPFHLRWFRYVILINDILPYSSYYWSNIGITWTIPIIWHAYLISPFLKKIFNKFRSVCFLYYLSLVIHGFISAHCMGYFDFALYLPFFTVGMLVYVSEKECFLIDANLMLLLILVLGMIVKWDILISSSLCGLILVAVLIKNNWTSKMNPLISGIDSYVYEIYLMQGVVFCSFIDKTNFSRWVDGILSVGGTLLLAFVSHKVIEILVCGNNQIKSR